MNEKPTILDKLGKAISIAGNAILMNLLFLLCSLPIVTMGQAWCGLLSAARYNIRGDKWQDGFWKGFKNRFWRGTITWCIMAVIDAYFLLDVVHYWGVWDTPFIFASLVFLLMIMVTFALPLLNIYVPTRLGDWLRNAVNMIFKVPLELAVGAVAFWLPLLLLFLFPYGLWYAAMIFITVYYVLLAVGSTLLMKNALIFYLLDARKEGVLLEDEGKKQEENRDEETEEESSDEETEEE